MYNSHYGSSSPAQFSNNPFVDDPSNPSNRYPDINAIDRSTGYAPPTAPYAAQLQTGYSAPAPSTYANGYGTPSGFGQQQQGINYQQPQSPQYTQPQGFSGGWQQQQQATGVPYNASAYAGAGTGYGGTMSPQQTGVPYQSTFGAGQYPQQQGYGGYATPQYGYQGYTGQQTGYGARAQPSVSEFDPLARPQQTPSTSYTGSSSSGSNVGPTTHPRDYIRSHKRELETWDSASWKQALNAFDALRSGWEAHRGQVQLRLQQGAYYLGPAEGQRLQGLQREAEHNIDSITASSVQMQEVLQGYRQSSDLASKNRVRESVNAALQSLPDWPPQNW
ncbi:hypothetical protein M0805_002379 [Coniferiporia weirii]|nr:hypothetical protein M0805_002379 [Coniferiporia weirii]